MIYRKSINLDITTKCTLACPECRRTILIKGGIKINGGHMTFSDFKKVHSFFDKLIFCGGVSDPIFHPQLAEFLEYSIDKDVEVHTAASHRSEDWYKKAFRSNPNATWIFGIDGLPEESHKYRVNQDGVKLFGIMKMAADMDIKTQWQYLIFDYNKDHIDEARAMAGTRIKFFVMPSRTFKAAAAS
jgi:MoaA/NifB/PqqE/SkfB family radical SAM enzyme